MRHSSCTKIEYQAKVADLCSYSKAVSSKLIKKKFVKFFEKGNFSSAKELYISIAMNIENTLSKNFKSLRDLQAIFRTNEDCIKFLEELIWEGEPVSPYDKSSKVYECKDGWYKCKNTGKEFNILTGTLFQGTKIPLPIWFEIIFRENSDKQGLPAKKLVREYGFSYKTAWHILHKIRNAMGKENYQELSGKVEVDEYYQGGILKNMHYDKKLKARERGIFQNKNLILGLVERGGNAVATVIPDKSDSTLSAGVLRYVKHGSMLYSDENPSYSKVPPFYKYASVNHKSGNYVDKFDNSIHTNTIESFWATLTRTLRTYIHVSYKHLQNYVNEQIFRYNTRKMEANEACIWFLQNIKGTNITWKEIRDGKYRQYNRNQKRAA